MNGQAPPQKTTTELDGADYNADDAMDFYADQWAAAYDQYVAAYEARADTLADEQAEGSQP